ncbi:MAG TPA: glycosyltransferase [Phycisphaerae bacterium]|jgi:glycosyltransferase involved in cell wall biosynthesis
MRICHVATSDMTLGLLFAGQLRYKIELGFEVWGVCAPGPFVEAARAEGVHVHTLPIQRERLTPRDAVTLVRLIWFFLWHRFDIVEISTPKAVLLGSLAAWLTRQPLRIVTLRGAYYETQTGLKRAAFLWAQRLGCALATRVVTICHELRAMALRDRVCRPDKLRTYLSGSSNGIDLARFSPTAERMACGRALRRQYQVPDEAIVIGNVGRLHREKGIVELLEAFESLLARGRPVWLLLVGGFDTVHVLPDDVRRRIETHPRIINVGQQSRTENFYPAMDIFAFPTYREGFGNVALEASAMGLPLVASDVIGCRESAPAGIASIAVPPRDSRPLAAALDQLVCNPDLRRHLGESGQRRAREQFAREKLWRAILADYAELLARQGKSLPPRAAAELARDQGMKTSIPRSLDPSIPSCRTCHITAHDSALANLYLGRHRFMASLGFEVWGVCPPGPLVEWLIAEGVRVQTIPMARRPNPAQDLRSLWRLIRLFAVNRFDLIEIGTPKAVLLASVAAWLTRQPLRIVIIHGGYYEGFSGLRRRLFMWTDRLGCALAQRVVAVSRELRDDLIRDRICAADKVIVYHRGSCAGIDLQRFCPKPELTAAGRELRRRHHGPDDAVVIGTVCRIKREKGIGELIEAFDLLRARGRNVRLLIVGGFEEHDPLPERVHARIAHDAHITWVGHQWDTERYYPAMDIFAFPTWREGFGNVALEAAAMGLPIVASDVAGCRESAPSGIASLLVPPRNAAALAEALDRLVCDPEYRRRLGASGQQRVRRDFDRYDVWRHTLADYGRLLARQGKSLPPKAAAFVSGLPEVAVEPFAAVESSPLAVA